MNKQINRKRETRILQAICLPRYPKGNEEHGDELYRKAACIDQITYFSFVL